MSDVRGVIFDWGGTLTQPIEVIYEIDTWSKVAELFAGTPHDELVVRLGAIEAELWEMSRTTQRSASIEGLIRKVVEEFGFEVAAESLEQAARFHLDALTPHITHDEDAREVLTALKERGVRIGLLSNTLWPSHFHERLLEEAGIRDLIDARMYSSHMRFTKPHPQAFKEALEAIGLNDPGEAVFVGDRPWDDIYGAKTFGMRTVLRPNPLVPSHEVVPDATISQLPELLPVIDGWNS